MPSKSKRKGNGWEREIVEAAKRFGFDAKRAWGSNGEALGKGKDVDVVIDSAIGDVCVQAKRRAKLPAYLCIPDGCHAVAFRQDKGEAMVLVPMEWWLEQLANVVNMKTATITLHTVDRKATDDQ